MNITVTGSNNVLLEKSEFLFIYVSLSLLFVLFVIFESMLNAMIEN